MDALQGKLKSPLTQLTLSLALILSCSPKPSNSPARTVEGSITDAEGKIDDNNGVPEGGDSKGADSLIAEKLASTTLFTKEAVEGNCLKASFVITAGGAPVVEAGVIFRILTPSVTQDMGTLEPTSALADADGRVQTTYCSGDQELDLTIQAQAGELTADTEMIKSRRKPVYTFRYTRSDAPIVQVAQANDQEVPTGQDPADSGVLRLNLIDSGPNDCTNIYFQVKRSDDPIVGAEVTFRTQVDYPKGSKLAKKDNLTPTSEIDPLNGKKYATFLATSNSEGEFSIPVCAGVSLGTMVVSGTYNSPEEKVLTAQGPVITITAGLANYQSFSLTYDPVNGKAVRGFFNTNADHKQPFQVKLSARQDGDVITDYPVSVASELGKITLENGGIPSEGGTVGFTLQALHLVDQYPYQKTVFSTTVDSVHQTRCSPIAINKISPNLTFKELKENWLNTIVYMVRGQESFNDANRNGAYDVGGDGFWDKNQNGIYDECGAVTETLPVDDPDELCDELTFDGNGDGIFTPDSEWFIDLPTPFVDVDKDGSFNSNVDILIGDEYNAPNKKRDADTLIWKNDILPIYMGTSTFAMQHADFTSLTASGSDTIGGAYFQSVYTNYEAQPNHATELFANNIDEEDLWANASLYATESKINRFLFAHGICGNPVLGGSTLTISFTDVNLPLFGDRQFSGHFYVQPLDKFREPSRRLLAKSDGSNEAVMNFNYTDHPAAAASYPIEFQLYVGPCENECIGAVSNAGVICGAKKANVNFTIADKVDPNAEQTSIESTSVTYEMSIPAVSTCTCGLNASPRDSVCECNNGFELNATGTDCQKTCPDGQTLDLSDTSLRTCS